MNIIFETLFILEKEIYNEIALLENDHWWYVSRRTIIEKFISGLNLDKSCNILEIGCGTGGNLKFLSNYGQLYAMEMDSMAIELANRYKITSVEHGFLPDCIPFKNKLFDIIIMLDVLEHIEDDGFSLTAVSEKLKPGGRLIITVPAYHFLWGSHDILAQHKRRYTKRKLCTLLRESGFIGIWASYYNTLLFPIIVLIRLINKVFRKVEQSDNKMPHFFINFLLIKIFSFERNLLPQLSFPFGVSILGIAKTNAEKKLITCRTLSDN